ncbi:MAG: RluA family pseudouridine synthase [Candidatus Omnitrophica bacterium]|nr:RluA family pseudouridine synthase [Candidatus Omnitrophota bacterium]
MNIPIVYEDDWLVILDKPAGLLVIPTPKKEKRTLTSILNQYCEEKKLKFRLHPCHRLDRETSGLIVFAKGKAIQEKMMQMFFKKEVKKTYIAFVHGSLKEGQGIIKANIEAKAAQTQYRVIGKRKDFSILEVSPLTGRKNQIRIHFKNIGHPLVGETRFAFRKDFALKAKRVCLHALSLEFSHPITKKTIKIEAKLATDLEEFLKAHPN